MIGRIYKLKNPRRSQSGFTLLELVVVLSIMLILSTMGFVAYQASTPPGAVSAARNELHGLLRFARNQAIMRGSNSMLIINYDSSDEEKFLRYVGVIVEEEYNSTIWKAAHSGVYLPKGVYFVPQSVVDEETDSRRDALILVFNVLHNSLVVWSVSKINHITKPF